MYPVPTNNQQLLLHSNQADREMQLEVGKIQITRWMDDISKFGSKDWIRTPQYRSGWTIIREDLVLQQMNYANDGNDSIPCQSQCQQYSSQYAVQRMQQNVNTKMPFPHSMAMAL